MTTAAPVSLSLAGRKTVSVGCVTLVVRLMWSVSVVRFLAEFALFAGSFVGPYVEDERLLRRCCDASQYDDASEGK